MDFLPHIYLACFDGCEKEVSMEQIDAALRGEEQAGFYSECVGLLKKYDPERLGRLGQMKLPEDRLRSFWAGLLIQGAVFHQTGFYPLVAYRKSGKPYIKSPEHLRISLSHAGDLVVLALSVTDTGDTVDLSRGRNCRKGICSMGIDVEQERTILHPDKFLRYCMEDSEREAFTACLGEPSNEDLLHLWTVKESVLKCFGTGLGVSPKLAHTLPEALFEKCILPRGAERSPEDFRIDPAEMLLVGSGKRPAEEPALYHWQVTEEELRFFGHGELADLEHYVIEKRREAAASKRPEPLCEADGAPVRYACCTGKLRIGQEAYLSLCMKFYEEDPDIFSR